MARAALACILAVVILAGGFYLAHSTLGAIYEKVLNSSSTNCNR